MHIAYRQACLNAIEYLKKFGYSGAQAYSILGTAPVPGPHLRRGRRAQRLRHAVAADARSSTSTSCRRRPGPIKHIKGDIQMPLSPGQVIPARRAGADGAHLSHGPASRFFFARCRATKAHRAKRCRSTNISATIAARSPTCGRWPNATIRRTARNAQTMPRA